MNEPCLSVLHKERLQNRRFFPRFLVLLHLPPRCTTARWRGTQERRPRAVVDASVPLCWGRRTGGRFQRQQQQQRAAGRGGGNPRRRRRWRKTQPSRHEPRPAQRGSRGWWCGCHWRWRRGRPCRRYFGGGGGRAGATRSDRNGPVLSPVQRRHLGGGIWRLLLLAERPQGRRGSILVGESCAALRISCGMVAPTCEGI